MSNHGVVSRHILTAGTDRDRVDGVRTQKVKKAAELRQGDSLSDD